MDFSKTANHHNHKRSLSTNMHTHNKMLEWTWMHNVHEQQLFVPHSSSALSFPFFPWHCPPHPPHLPHSCTPLHLGSWPKTWQNHCHMMPMRVMLHWDPPPLRKCSGPFSHPSVPLWRAGHYNRIQLPSQSIPDWFQPLLGYGFPQTMRICPNFKPAGALGIKLWITKAVYDRTEEFELHNRQLSCPLIPLPFIQFVVCL